MKAHRSLLTLALVLVLLVLAACGGAPTQQAAEPTAASGSGEAAQPTAAPAAEEPAAEAPAEEAPAEEAPAAEAEQPTPTPGPSTVGSGATKIVWWHISTDEAGRANWDNLANQFVQEHPDVSIEITVLANEDFKAKLATAMQSGNPPDIFQSWGGGVLRQYAEAGLVQDLTPALQQDGWGETFQPGPLSLYTFDGKTYGVPWNAGMVGFWYNKALFEQAGITQPPQTWTEFLDAVQKLKAAGITPIALGERDKWPGHFYWVYLATRIGGRDAFEAAYNRSGSFADPPFVEAGVRLKELIDLEPFQNGFLGADYGQHQAQMANGLAAMELMGQWAPNANRGVAEDVEAYNANLGWFPFPVVEGGAGDPSDVLGGGDGFAIGRNAPPEAIEFVKFLTSVEVQTAMAEAGLAVPPTVKGAEVALADDPLMQEVQRRASEAKYYQLYYDQYLPPAVGATVNDATQALFAGTATPEEVAQMIEDAAAMELMP
ncbi:MAG: extracellular solute-binding protein [Chloroflexota bacterium]